MSEMHIAATIKSEGQRWVVLQIAKAIVVISREQFMAGLRMGKRFKRSEALRQRIDQAKEAREERAGDV